MKRSFRVFSFIFSFLIGVCITWACLGWRRCGCVLMYYFSFRNFTFCFYWFLFYFRLLVYICVVGVFLYVFVSMFVCLLICFVVLFRFYSLFVSIYCLCYVTVLCQFFFESICCSKMRLSYSVCLLIDCIHCILENLS